MLRKIIYVILCWIITQLLSLTFFSISVLILYLIFNANLDEPTSLITELEPILNALLYSLLIAPLALIPGFFLNRKIGQWLNEKKKWELGKIEHLIYLAYGIYVLPLILLLALQLLG